MKRTNNDSGNNRFCCIVFLKNSDKNRKKYPQCLYPPCNKTQKLNFSNCTSKCICTTSLHCLTLNSQSNKFVFPGRRFLSFTKNKKTQTHRRKCSPTDSFQVLHVPHKTCTCGVALCPSPLCPEAIALPWPGCLKLSAQTQTECWVWWPTRHNAAITAVQAFPPPNAASLGL